MPNKLFPEYSKLKENIWNGTHLTYEDHYISHSLLVEAIDNFSMTAAWWAMNNKNKIDYKTIIGKEKYSELKSVFTKNIGEKVSAWANTKDEQGITNSERIGKKRSKEMMSKGTYKLIGKKISETVNKIKENGKTIAQERGENRTICPIKLKEQGEQRSKKYRGSQEAKLWAKKAAETRYNNYTEEQKQRYKDIRDFKPMSSKDQQALAVKSMKKVFIKDGKETTKYKEAGLTRIKTLNKTRKYFILKNINGEVINKRMNIKELSLISQKLHLKTKEDYLGKSKVGAKKLINNNKENLIGLYVEEIKNGI